MSSIDRRVVEAKFDNKQFRNGVKETLDDLSSLNKGLKLDNAARGFSEIDRAAKGLSLEGVQNSVQSVADQFSALRVVGLAVLASLATKAVDAGLKMAKSLSFDGARDGLREYETNLNSIQTILSNTKWEDKGLQDVNAALDELNEYADLTIYNFAEMARNIGTFTAAGVELDVSVGAIKGIANLAAVSGSNAQQASTTMYQLSQALSTGTVKLMDWNSVVNAGMGGKVFQDAIKDTARAHGVSIDQIIEDQGSFRDSLQTGWFTAEILTDTLNTFTGDLTDAQLKTMGYTEEQIEGIQEMAGTAVDAATKVKTFSQLVEVAQEAVGTGWADTFKIVLGDFEEAKELFTGMSESLGVWISASSEARNSVLTDWKELGGRTEIIEGIRLAIEDLLSIIKPIKDAFKDIFPAVTGEQLYNYSVALREFFETFKMGEDTTENLRRTFRGLFAAFGIGFEVIKEVGRFLFEIFSRLTEGSRAVLDFTGDMGDFVVSLYEAIKSGEGLRDFFDGLLDNISPAIDGLRTFIGFLGDLASKIDIDFASLPDLSVVFEPFATLGDFVSAAWSGAINVMQKAYDVFRPLALDAKEFFQTIGGAISDTLAGLDVDYGDVLSAINTGLFATLVTSFRGFLNNFKGIGDDAGGIVSSITDSFGGLTDTLSTMQNTLRATTLLQIAAAVGILAASTVALSKIDEEGLKRALTGLTALFVELFAALAGFQLVGGARGLTFTAVGLTALAVALRILVESVEALSTLEWEDLAKGLSGVAALIGAVVVAARGLSGLTGLVPAATGILIMSGAIKVLASAVSDLSDLDWEEMGRGLLGVGALLAGLALFTRVASVSGAGVIQGAGLILLAVAIRILADATAKFGELEVSEIVKGLSAVTVILAVFAGFTNVVNPAGIVKAGASLLIISGAMLVLAEATERFGALSWEEVGKGLLTMAGALTAIVLALNLMPPTTLASATSLAIVGGALLIIGEALKNMGGMSWEEIGKGLTILAGSLLIIAAAMYAMTGALPGAAATLVVAGSLAILVPLIQSMGDMSWSEIGKGLATLAGVFVILGLAGVALTPVIPTLIGLGIAIGLIGAGVALAGVGILALATGLAALAAAGAGAAVAVAGIAAVLIGLIPYLAIKLAEGLVVFLGVILAAAPGIIAAMADVIVAMIEAIEELVPDILGLVGTLVTEILGFIIDISPEVGDAALELMMGILDATIEATPEIINKVLQLLSMFADALIDAAPGIADRGAELLIAVIDGINRNIQDIQEAASDLIIDFIAGIGEHAEDVIEAGVETVIQLLEGIATSLETHQAEFEDAGRSVAFALADGLTLGLASKVRELGDAAVGMARTVLDRAKSFLGVESPSKEFYEVGKFVSQGFANGLIGSKDIIVRSWDAMYSLLDAARDSARGTVADMEGRISDLNESSAKIAEDLGDAAVDLDRARAAIEAKLADPEQEVTDSDLDRVRDLERRIRDLTKAQRENNEEIRISNDRRREARKEELAADKGIRKMRGALKDEYNELKRLGSMYDSNAAKLDKANQKLQEATRLRDSYRSSITDQYSDSPDPIRGQSVETYISSLKNAKNETKKFTSVMGQLREAGLSDRLYEEYLSQGVDILPFLERILKGGPAVIDEINKLDSGIASNAKKLGKNASNELYQAGVEAAKGVVQGLEASQKRLLEAMEKIAKLISETLERKLEIKSPSRITDQIGKRTGEGLIKGLESTKDDIFKKSSEIGKTAIEAMRDSISSMSTDLSGDIQPVVRPIIDMTEVRKGLLGVKSTAFSTRIGVDRASSSFARETERRRELDLAGGNSAPTVIFKQTNNSPVSLSSAEIFRQTRNQLSRAKGVLGNATTDT